MLWSTAIVPRLPEAWTSEEYMQYLLSEKGWVTYPMGKRKVGGLHDRLRSYTSLVFVAELVGIGIDALFAS